MGKKINAILGAQTILVWTNGIGAKMAMIEHNLQFCKNLKSKQNSFQPSLTYIIISLIDLQVHIYNGPSDKSK